MHPGNFPFISPQEGAVLNVNKSKSVMFCSVCVKSTAVIYLQWWVDFAIGVGMFFFIVCPLKKLQSHYQSMSTWCHWHCQMATLTEHAVPQCSLLQTKPLKSRSKSGWWKKGSDLTSCLSSPVHRPPQAITANHTHILAHIWASSGNAWVLLGEAGDLKWLEGQRMRVGRTGREQARCVLYAEPAICGLWREKAQMTPWSFGAIVLGHCCHLQLQMRLSEESIC